MTNPKLTIDLTEENREILEQIKEDLRRPYGNTVNLLISNFGRLPGSVKKELTAFIKPQIKQIYKQMDDAGDYDFSELSAKMDAYLGIIKFLNDGKNVSLESIEAEPTLTRMFIKDGILIYPEDYILVNPEEANTSLYAGVIECRNSDKFGKAHFGKPIPHFLFLCNKKYGSEYDDAFLNRINKMCIDAWSDFKVILDSQVTPIDDPEKPGHLINADEWMEAPTIGHFALYEQGDKRYGSNYEPPAGAMIIRTRQTTEED